MLVRTATETVSYTQAHNQVCILSVFSAFTPRNIVDIHTMLSQMYLLQYVQDLKFFEHRQIIPTLSFSVFHQSTKSGTDEQTVGFDLRDHGEPAFGEGLWLGGDNGDPHQEHQTVRPKQFVDVLLFLCSRFFWRCRRIHNYLLI